MKDTKPVRILHFSPHDEDDGIARYQEQYLAGLQRNESVENNFFEITPFIFRKQNPDEQAQTLKRLKRELKEYDILHVQHEFGLFGPGDFQRIIETAKSVRCRIVVSVHLSPGFAIKQAKLGGLGPHSLILYARQRRYQKRMIEWHITPLLSVDKVLVHNDITAQALQQAGVDSGKIQKIVHPVYDFPQPPDSNVIRQKLAVKPGDIIYATVGMMHRYKGIYDAIKALKFLPHNYKLAIIGGVHPLSEDMPMYNKAADLIDTLGLRDRVYITGFVRDDNQFNALIRECDICIFPYSGVYYAHLSSGSINLAFSNEMPVVAYPTEGFKELAGSADGAVVVTDTFAYYELAREIENIDIPAQIERSKAYAVKMAWPKLADELAKVYLSLR